MPATATPITRTAQFPSDCRKGCGTRIAAGDTITPASQGFGWAHVTCPERAAVETVGATFIVRPVRMASADADIFGAPAAPRAQSVGVQVDTVLDGRYTVVLQDGTRRTIRLAHGRNATNSDVQFVSYLSGSNNDRDYTNCGFVKNGEFRWSRRFIDSADWDNDSPLSACVHSLLSADRETRARYGMAYAVESGNCSRCGRTLTVPASIAMGLGPICADAGY